ncbi:hypothetical protein DY000_02041212 [Brassica cretica]|uniref:Aspartic peptidase DDI1-type domain-containing protein n=1 Tax=Brassica cretica TaxID=69181 RepID=A0ABQ7BEQ9_BRACR|nr:hypothetical protein DY000_02041212 [Brassica cretica]
MPYRVRLPDLDAHRLKETQNPSQTSVSLKTIEKISPQSAEAPEQEKSTLAETSFVESVDRRHLPSIDRRHLLGIDQHQTDRYEPAMERQATKEEISVENRVKSRKPYIPKHLRREVNKEELEGFHKRVKRVPKDMSFDDAYHKYRLGNFFRERKETDKDIELLFNKVSRKPKRTLKKKQDPGKFLIPCSIHSHHLPNALCDTGSAVSIMTIDTAELLGLKMEPSKERFTFVDSYRVNSAGMIKNVKVEIGECIIPVDFHAMDIKSGKTSPLLFGGAFMATVEAVWDLKRNKMCLTNVDETVFYDPMEKKKKSASVDIRIAASVDFQSLESIDFQSSESIDNQPSASDDSQSSESIDTKPSASIDTLRLLEQPETEKSKSGGKTKNIKKKKKRNVDADFLSLVPLQCQEASLAYRVRCRGGSESFTKSFEFSFQFHRFEVNQHHVAEVMLVLPRSGQSVSRERVVDGTNGMSIDGAPLPSIDGDARMWSEHIL